MVGWLGDCTCPLAHLVLVVISESTREVVQESITVAFPSQH